MQKYLGIGSHANEAGSLGAAYNRLLGDDFALRNLYAGAEGAGLTRISTVIHPAIHGINRDIHTTERAIDAETRKPPAKRNHGLLARLRDRITTLKRRRGQWETSETNLTGTLIPDFVSGLVSQQGPGLTHAVLSSVPDMEFFGGSSELFNVLRDIRDLNLRKFEQPDTSDASGDGGVGDAAAAEDNARNDQLLELYKSMLEAAQREIAVQRIEAPIAAQYPVMHDGGIFHAPGGAREGLALLEEGERVTPAGAGDTEFHFHFDPATGRAWVEQIVDGKLERTVRAVSGGAPMGRSTAYG